MPKQADLDLAQRKQVVAHEEMPPSVIFEVIRRDGEHALSRPASALWWSGVAAGLAISTSVLAKGFLASILPQTDPAAAITPILPLFFAPTWYRFARTARLWGIVCAANLAGCFAAALVLVHAHILPAARFEGILSISRHYAEATPFQHFAWGIPAGFLIAALVWILPRLKSAGEVLMIVIVTYFIGLGGMSHVVAGSTELFVLVVNGELGLIPAIFGGVLPALAGNVLGGTGIFATLTYAQVHEEI
jgi:formate/nitrite transporter FocA (FNT family)